MEISFRELGNHKVLEVDGDVDLYNVGELKQAVFRILDEEDIESLIIDMSGINYMDSSGVGALVAGQKKVKTQGGKFSLLNITEDVFNILRLATLDQFFTIYEDESEIEGVNKLESKPEDNFGSQFGVNKPSESKDESENRNNRFEF